MKRFYNLFETALMNAMKICAYLFCAFGLFFIYCIVVLPAIGSIIATILTTICAICAGVAFELSKKD